MKPGRRLVTGWTRRFPASMQFLNPPQKPSSRFSTLNVFKLRPGAFPAIFTAQRSPPCRCSATTAPKGRLSVLQQVLLQPLRRIPRPLPLPRHPKRIRDLTQPPRSQRTRRSTVPRSLRLWALPQVPRSRWRRLPRQSLHGGEHRLEWFIVHVPFAWRELECLRNEPTCHQT